MKNIKIFVPYNINVSVLENNNNKIIYLYNNNYFFSLISTKLLFINYDSKYIHLYNTKLNNKISLFNNELNNFLYSWETIFFNKIKFTGKGFKFKKKINNIFLYFNRAHKCFFIGKNIIVKRLSKNKIILLKNNFYDLTKDSIILRNIRKNNIFTKRGLRFSRQIILKKKGKTTSN